MKLITLALVIVYSAVAIDIPEPVSEIWNDPLANKLGENDIYRHRSDFVRPYNPSCVAAFGEKFTRIKPLSSGYFGSVYIAYGRNGNSYILKAVQMKHEQPLNKILLWTQGITRIDEIKIGKFLTDKVISQSKSGAFMATLDWFQCNLLEICDKFCFDTSKNCKVPNNLRRGEADTQFIVIEFIPGRSLYEFVVQDHSVALNQITNFMRSITFQVLLAMQKAYDEIRFVHFDMNFNNVRLQPVDGGPDENFIFTDNQQTWRIPLSDSLNQRARIIDFGISKANVPSHIGGGELPVGPRFTNRFNALQSLQFSVFMFFFSLVSSIPCDTMSRWRDTDPVNYGQFVDVFNDAMGFKYMDRSLGILSGLQPLSKPTRNPRKLGIPDFCIIAKMKQMEYRNMWSLSVIIGAGTKPFNNGDVTPRSLLNYAFYQKYQSQ